MNHAGSNVVGFFIIVGVIVSTIVLGILFAVGWFNGFGRYSRILLTITGLLFIPLFLFSCVLGFAVLKSQVEVTRNHRPPTEGEIWANQGFMNSMIADYYLINPDAFDFPNQDDEAVSPRVLNYLSQFFRSNQSGFSIKDGKLISPFGDEVIIVIDRDGNNILEARGYSRPYNWANNVRQCAMLRLEGNDSNRWSALPGWIARKPGVDYSSVK